MTVTDFDSGDKFTFRVVKYHASNPDRKWQNTYEFKATESGGESALLALGGILVTFESSLHLGIVVFDRLLISTWEPDSIPYDPAVFISSTLTAVGEFGGTGDPIGLGQAFCVTRQSNSGRFGHVFYRGCLTEAMVAAPSGKTVLDDRAGNQATIDGALSSSGLADYIGVLPDAGLAMVLVNKAGTNVRPVTSFFAQGVTNLPMDHAWFNRTHPAP